MRLEGRGETKTYSILMGFDEELHEAMKIAVRNTEPEPHLSRARK